MSAAVCGEICRRKGAVGGGKGEGCPILGMGDSGGRNRGRKGEKSQERDCHKRIDGLNGTTYNIKESADCDCIRQCLTGISSETVVEMAVQKADLDFFFVDNK